MKGNFGFASRLLDTLKKYDNKCGVMLSSSIQATLIGRYADSDYGKSKLAGENLFFNYANEAGTKVYVKADGMYIVFLICLVSGADQIITVQ